MPARKKVMKGNNENVSQKSKLKRMSLIATLELEGYTRTSPFIVDRGSRGVENVHWTWRGQLVNGRADGRSDNFATKNNDKVNYEER